MATMRAAILTREYPPDVYGGAGVHVDFLVRELRALLDLEVHCMGEPREGATAHSEHDPRLAGANQALSIEHLVAHADELEPRVHGVPEEIDCEVARLKLESLGVEIDTLTDDQRRYLHSWEQGT